MLLHCTDAAGVARPAACFPRFSTMQESDSLCVRNFYDILFRWFRCFSLHLRGRNRRLLKQARLRKARARKPSRSTTPSRWPSSTITTCWLRAPRFSKARPRRSPPICGLTPCFSATRSSCRSFSPSQFSADYLDNTAQFDLGVSYLFERGKKRQHRLQAAKDVTAETTFSGRRQRAHPHLQRCLAIHRR